MTDLATIDAFGALTAPDTLRIQRLLPGPVEAVWAYLTDGELRRQWLAAGTMDLSVGATFELVWRNDELTDPPGPRPADFGTEHRMESRIVEVDPPRRLVFTWGAASEVAIDLAPEGDDVVLTLVHRRLPERPVKVMICAGWHAHLDLLADRLATTRSAPFWESWTRLRDEYERRVPA